MAARYWNWLVERASSCRSPKCKRTRLSDVVDGLQGGVTSLAARESRLFRRSPDGGKIGGDDGGDGGKGGGDSGKGSCNDGTESDSDRGNGGGILQS